MSRLDLPRVERRAFLRYGMFGAVSAGLGGFGLASLGFLYPRPGDELTGEVPLEDAESLAATITETRAPVRVPDGGISIVTWDPGNDTAMANYGEDHAIVESAGVGLMALYTQRVRAPRVRRAVVPDLAVVRVPLPRVALQPLGRVHRRARAARARPLLVLHRRGHRHVRRRPRAT